MNNKKIKFFVVFLLVLVVLNTLGYYISNKNQPDPKTLANFVTDVKDGKVVEATIVQNGKSPLEIKVLNKDKTSYKFYALNDSGLRISDVLSENKVKFFTKPPEEPSLWYTFFFSYGPTILFLGVWIYFMTSMSKGGSGGKGIFGFNKSKAKLIKPENLSVAFADVVGCDEAKLEIQEFVDFLKNPEKFEKMGGKTPKGVLLSGPAGTGKTLLAKALAKESGVPFYGMSGSDFVEMFVGVGAARVRDLFETARQVAPCVLFIDEIDAIGGKRGGGFSSGGSDEREQTLNQLLVELDGIEGKKGVVLVCATNRPETLDKALIRPGRIDRQIVMPLPDIKGREQILKIHSKEVPLKADVNLAKIARGTPGFSGAELANLINEAALFAVRKNKVVVDLDDLEEAKDKILMGVQRPSMSMSDETKKETAYHEAGHAVVAKLVDNSDPVYKVTIIPRGRALGVTMQLPEEDKHTHKQEYLIDQICIMMGGRAAEEIFCNTYTNGASGDISSATGLATSMVTQWGMSKLGPIKFGNIQSSFLGSSGLDTSNLSPKDLQDVNEEIRTIINTQYNRAKQILLDNKDIVDAMTDALMEIETINEEQIINIVNRKHYNHVDVDVVDVEIKE